MPQHRLSHSVAASLALLTLGLSACSTGFYKKWADKEVFGILGKKASKVPNSGQAFLDITPPPPVKMEALRKNMETVEFLGERAYLEKDARIVSLADALDFAVHRNRSYLLQKEVVYLAALNLTLTRQQFGPILSGGGSTTLASTKVQSGVNNLVRTSTLTTTGGMGFSALSRTGTLLATNLTTNFLRFFTGGADSAVSQLGASLSQPLLAGAGYLSASETLTQGERNVLYAIRSFAQYRKSFAVDVATQYFRTIQARESAKNAYLGFKAFNFVVERETAMQKENASTKSSLYRLSQQRLVFNRSWINARRNYEQALDDLKIQLGLPVTERIVLDYKDMHDLKIIDPDGSLDEALTTALTARLDLWNTRDQMEDASRKVLIAKQQVLPTVNSLVTYNMLDNPDRNDFAITPRNRSTSAGVNADLNLNQKPERNSLRAQMIAEQRARRELDLAEEQVRGDVRSGWRDLELARKQYELARRGMEISTARLELEEGFNAEGLGTAINLVDAQRDMNATRDLMVSTTINHTLVRLQLWRDMGVLFIEKDGSWVDVMNKEKIKGE
ncbi:MAG: TolC family protein [Prosthecobacter sp.]|uniref:TolC family protein n=1 Tax=Prosthecobacter sp. TaxID=1965333 RepID=UPI001A0F02B7|nr:TolC family protein [Prosthecobacter sp.]MBE2282172.1 TolC family protein [Prosthecobacter sp.]